jgi:hypothetical protein
MYLIYQFLFIPACYKNNALLHGYLLQEGAKKRALLAQFQFPLITYFISAAPNRNSASFSSFGHDNSESCSTHSNASSFLSDERKMVDDETSTPDAPEISKSPASLDPPMAPKDVSDQETEVGSIGEKVSIK